jgi:multicomponent Na+:H+ antiporter subunit A
MDLLIVVLSGFALALVTPWLHRILGGWLGYVVALLPVAIVALLLGDVGHIDAEQTASVRYEWAPSLGLSLSLFLDGLGLFFALMISSIGVLIAIYASGYLAGDRQLGAFYAYFLMFMSAMLGIALAGNLLTLYVFWELTTLSSFLLIGYEHGRDKARWAAQQALLVTALGGLCLLAGLVLLGMAGGTFEIRELLERGDQIRGHVFYGPILALILLGAFTKSAQFPFHFWLPNAMEAPTPVSAYLHSATMVKAGVFLLARFSPVLGNTDLWLWTVMPVGAITMVLGAVLAFTAHDLKQILAWLTINVLGTLVMLIGLGNPLAIEAAMTYLMAHALYKGALFLMAGAVDHAAHTRDVRELRGLWRAMPLTSTAAGLAALSMAGVVPLFGFVAKELYLEAIWKSPHAKWWLTAASVAASALLVAGAGLVAARPFFGRPSEKASHAHEAGFSLLLGPIVLSLSGIAVGLLPDRLAGPLVRPAVAATLGAPAEFTLKLWHGITIPFALSLTALAGGVVLYLGRERLLRAGTAQSRASRWGPSAQYDRALAGLNRLARQTRVLQSGYLRLYVLTVVSVVAVLVGALLLRLEPNFERSAGLGIRFHEAVAAVLIPAAALVAVRSVSRLRAVAALGVVGFNVAWVFHLFGAPDLAMTQLVIESLTVILFVLAFYRLPSFTTRSRHVTRARDAVVCLITGGLFTVLLLLVTRTPTPSRVSRFYAQNSLPEAHGRNLVNVILVDFRALDTLGEITVLSTAAVGVYALLKLTLPKKEPP